MAREYMMTEKQKEFIKSLAVVCGYGESWERAVAEINRTDVYFVLSHGVTRREASKTISVLRERSVDGGSEDASIVVRG